MALHSSLSPNRWELHTARSTLCILSAYQAAPAETAYTWCLIDTQGKEMLKEEEEGEKRKWRDGRETHQRGSECTSASCVQIWPRDKGQWVFPVGFDFSFPCLTAQNFGSDGTHILRSMLSVSGIRAHNESHSSTPAVVSCCHRTRNAGHIQGTTH